MVSLGALLCPFPLCNFGMLIALDLSKKIWEEKTQEMHHGIGCSLSSDFPPQTPIIFFRVHSSYPEYLAVFSER